jgi:hypothetical protein
MSSSYNSSDKKYSGSRQCHHQVKQLYVSKAHRIAEHDRMVWYQEAPLAMAELSKHLALVHANGSGHYEQEYSHNHERFKMVGPVSKVCKTHLENYGEGDSEKRACGLKVLEKMTSTCVVFCIGSNNEWGFEEAVFKNTNCRIETFDCKVGTHIQPPEYIRSRTRLHRYCLGDQDDLEKSLLSWDSLLAIANTTRAPTYLKVDIEGYEYRVLKSIITTGRHLPLQIGFELHYSTYSNIFTGTVDNTHSRSF